MRKIFTAANKCYTKRLWFNLLLSLGFLLLSCFAFFMLQSGGGTIVSSFSVIGLCATDIIFCSYHIHGKILSPFSTFEKTHPFGAVVRFVLLPLVFLMAFLPQNAVWLFITFVYYSLVRIKLFFIITTGKEEGSSFRNFLLTWLSSLPCILLIFLLFGMVAYIPFPYILFLLFVWLLIYPYFQLLFLINGLSVVAKQSCDTDGADKGGGEV